MYMGQEEKLALDKLVGCVVAGLMVNADQSEALVLTNLGILSLPTSGDCCSESWWADIVGYKQLEGYVVRAVEWIEMPDPSDDRSRQECDQAYGLRICTSGGVCDLVFRNSSNGWYGGDCTPRWLVRIDDFTGIEGDWSA